MIGLEIKKRLWRRLLTDVSAKLAAMTHSQKTTHASATHEEAKPEHAKDTRALEQTYLARGLAVRVTELRADFAMLEAYAVKSFGGDQPIAITALVELEDEDGESRVLLLAPTGGGMRITAAGVTARVVTAEAPIGRALLGKKVGDEVELNGPAGKRALEITNVV